MFTAKKAQAKVRQARKASDAKEKQKEEDRQKEFEKMSQQAEERVDNSLVKALELIEEAAGKPLSTVRFEVGHRQGSPCLRTEKLTELVMKKLSDLGYRVINTNSDSREQTATVHFKAHVWRYEITIYW